MDGNIWNAICLGSLNLESAESFDKQSKRIKKMFSGSTQAPCFALLHHANNRRTSATAVPSPRPEISIAHQGAPCGREVKATKGHAGCEVATATKAGCRGPAGRRFLRKDWWSDMAAWSGVVAGEDSGDGGEQL